MNILQNRLNRRNRPVKAPRQSLIRSLALACLAASLGSAQAAASSPAGNSAGLLQPGRFVHIPGPNPVLVHGNPGAWDDGVIEAADAFHDGDTYYFYYHGTAQGTGYRLGVATASHPLGPFRKHGTKPILDLGPRGSWDERHVACGMVLREGEGRYLMFYSGLPATNSVPAGWSIGLATASHPLGPWKKYERNPVLEGFGYVGGVVKLNGKYHLYTEHPIGSTAPDYGPISLATADQPTGPWTRWNKNPVLPAGEKGAWDAGGFSEGEVLHFGGMFHLFAGGATVHPERIRTQESIGYASSADGFQFVKHPANPVAPREAIPNAAALSEVHALIEPPFIYLYHTLRYKEPRRPEDRAKFPNIEDLGIQVLATERPFQLTMPVLHRETLGPLAATALADSPPLCLGSGAQVELSVECNHSSRATKGIRVHVRASDDGLRWGETDTLSFDLDLRTKGTSRASRVVEPKPRFLKVLIMNLDPAESASGVTVTARLRG